MNTNKLILLIAAIMAVMVIETAAIIKGFNGKLFLTSLSAIGLIVGIHIPQPKYIKKIIE